MARLVSTEGASLIERQTAALFGDLQQLHQQMQVGREACLPVVVSGCSWAACSAVVSYPRSHTLEHI